MRRFALALAALLVVSCAVAVAYAQQQAAPTVATGAATQVKKHSATLHGTVRPNGANATWYFQYGTTTAYGIHTSNRTVSAGQGTQSVSRTVSGLLAGTTYHYRIVATNSGGTSLGADRTFTTPGPAELVTLSSSDTTVAFGHTVRLTGTVSAPNNSGVAVTLQARPYPYTSAFAQDGNTVLTGPHGEFAFNVVPFVNVQYRAVAQRGGVSVISPIVSETVRLSVSSTVTDSTPRKGQKVKLSGSVKPSHVGVTVRIQRRTSSGSYKTIARTHTKAASSTRAKYSIRVRISKTAYYRVKVSSGDGDHATGYSKRRRLRVH
jgi:hypothetical protein